MMIIEPSGRFRINQSGVVVVTVLVQSQGVGKIGQSESEICEPSDMRLYIPTLRRQHITWR